jgi:hypothetical protein
VFTVGATARALVGSCKSRGRVGQGPCPWRTLGKLCRCTLFAFWPGGSLFDQGSPHIHWLALRTIAPKVNRTLRSFWQAAISVERVCCEHSHLRSLAGEGLHRTSGRQNSRGLLADISCLLRSLFERWPLHTCWLVSACKLSCGQQYPGGLSGRLSLGPPHFRWLELRTIAR